MRRGGEFSIMFGHNELMNSRLGGSEEALAGIACERIRARERPRILIGGLGMGFTLRAALAALGTEARIVVAELGSRLIKSTTRGLRRGRQRPNNFAPACRNGWRYV
jgi:spermidine synthase